MFTIDGRKWFRAAADALAAGRTAGAIDFDKPAPGSEKLTAQQGNGLNLYRWNNRPLGAYLAEVSLLLSDDWAAVRRFAGG